MHCFSLRRLLGLALRKRPPTPVTRFLSQLRIFPYPGKLGYKHFVVRTRYPDASRITEASRVASSSCNPEWPVLSLTFHRQLGSGEANPIQGKCPESAQAPGRAGASSIDRSMDLYCSR